MKTESFDGLRARMTSNWCVHSTRVVFHPSKVKIRVRVPMDAILLLAASAKTSSGLYPEFLVAHTSFLNAALPPRGQKSAPTVGIEPTTTRLKVLRSTTELGGTRASAVTQ